MPVQAVVQPRPHAVHAVAVDADNHVVRGGVHNDHSFVRAQSNEGAGLRGVGRRVQQQRAMLLRGVSILIQLSILRAPRLSKGADRQRCSRQARTQAPLASPLRTCDSHVDGSHVQA